MQILRLLSKIGQSKNIQKVAIAKSPIVEKNTANVFKLGLNVLTCAIVHNVKIAIYIVQKTIINCWMMKIALLNMDNKVTILEANVN